MDQVQYDAEVAYRIGRSSREVFSGEPWAAVAEALERVWPLLCHTTPWDQAQPHVLAGWREAPGYSDA